MPGIYLHFRPQGLDQAALDDFDQRFASRATRLAGDHIEHVTTPQLRGAVIDHGHWPSGGVAAGDGARLLLSGSCWLDGERTSLATTDEALAELDRRLDEGVREPLRGIFAMAHVNAAGDRLVVDTDRFGTVPVYYRGDGQGGLRVASELKFLVDAGAEKPDLEGVADLLAISYHVRNRSAVAGVTRLPLHHRLEFGRAGLQTSRLPQPGYPRHIPVDADSLAEIDRRASLHFRRFAEHADRLAIALSGGLDSRLLLFNARRAGANLLGFTAGVKDNVDVALTRKLAAHLDLPLVEHLIDGRSMSDWLVEATWLSEGRTPFNHIHYFPALFDGTTPPEPQIHGLIGEAAIGGYLESDKYREADGDGRREGCHEFARGAALNWTGGLGETVLVPELLEAVEHAHADATDELLADLGFTGTYSDYLDFRFIYRGGLFGVPALTGQVLPWTDVISPFLDGDFYDYGASLKSDDIRDRVVQLRWGLECLPGFADLPRVKDGMLLPVRADDPTAYDRARKHLVARNKRRYLVTQLSGGRINPHHPEGFPHYAQWYRRFPNVRRLIDGILLDERTAERGLWRADGVRELLGLLRGGRNMWGTVGGVLLVELLCRLFIDGDPQPGVEILKQPQPR